GCDPNFLVLPALRIDLTLAIEALLAGNMMERYHAIARREFRYPGAYPRHHPRRLVTIDARGLPPIVFDLFQIGMANAARLHANQDFAGSDGRSRDLLHADDAPAAVHGRVHRHGYGAKLRIGSRQ